MIKSETKIMEVQKKNPYWLLICLAVFTTVSVRSLMLYQEYPSLMEVGIWYPLLVLTAFLGLRIVIKKIDLEQSFRLFLYVIGVSFLGSFISIWPGQAASMPLRITELPVYFLTLGIFPFDAGPDGFLRLLAIASAIVFGSYLYKTSRDLFGVIKVSLLIWLIASFVFTLPSLLLIFTVGVSGLSVNMDGALMMNEFTRMNLFSYWSDGQILRWFTGFGGQAVNAFLLYSASVVFVLSGIFFAVLNFKALKETLKKIKPNFLLMIVVLAAYGYSAGRSLQGFTELDTAAWAAFIVLILFAVLIYSERSAYEGLGEVLFFLGALVLGWPVFLGAVLIRLLIWVKDLMPENFAAQLFLDAVLSIAFVVLVLLFMRRGMIIEPEMLRIAALFGVFALLAAFHLYAKKMNFSNFYILPAWIGAAVLAWIAVGIFTPAAIILLGAVFAWLFWGKIKDYKWEFNSYIWLLALIVFLVVIYLPRLAHPELIPR